MWAGVVARRPLGGSCNGPEIANAMEVERLALDAGGWVEVKGKEAIKEEAYIWESTNSLDEAEESRRGCWCGLSQAGDIQGGAQQECPGRAALGRRSG